MSKVMGGAIALLMAVSPCLADNIPRALETTPQTPMPPTTPSTPNPSSAHPHTVYDDLFQSLSEQPKWDIDATKCDVTATIDYDKYYDKLPAFREAWLNKDYTLENNQHHSRQILDLIVMRYMAAIMTYAVYNSAENKPKTDCHFTAGISYTDKYGQTQSFTAVKWDFTNALSGKINWQKFDESKFNEIAENWRYTKGTDDFNRLEESMAADGKYHPLHEEEQPNDQAPSRSSCSIFLFNANAIFVRSTTFCHKDFMETRAGNIALEGAKECARGNTEQALKSATSHAMNIIDRLVRSNGRRFACSTVNEIQQQILAGKR